LLLCLSLMFQSSYAAGDSTVPEMGNMEIHQIAQQSSTIKGVVKDQKGEPLIGVSIVVKGTTNGTASDFDGNFTLDVPDNSLVGGVPAKLIRTIENDIPEETGE